MKTIEERLAELERLVLPQPPKVELEVGRWVVDDEEEYWICCFKDEEIGFGLNTHGTFFEKVISNLYCEDNRYATTEEIISKLTPEIRKRGFTGTISVKDNNIYCNEQLLLDTHGKWHEVFNDEDVVWYKFKNYIVYGNCYYKELPIRTDITVTKQNPFL